MGSIDVGVLYSRFRLPPGAAARDWLARIQAIRGDLVDTHLEPALAPFAMTDEVICVRQITLPLRLSAAVTDWQASLKWSVLIAEALKGILARNAPDEVLRFPHELAARAAFLADALTGRGERDWAWRQLTWLPAAGEGDRNRFDAAVAAAAAAGAASVALLRGVAAAGMLQVLCRSLTNEQRDRVLIAALAAAPQTAAAALVRWLMEPSAASEGTPIRPTTLAATPPAPAFRAVVAETTDAEARRVWAALAVLCCEPHRLRAAPEEAGAIAAAWLRQVDASMRALPRREAASPAEGEHRAAVAGDAAPTARDANRGAALAAPPPLGERHARRAASAAPDPYPQDEVEAPPVLARSPVEGETAFGGLLFLLPLVDTTGALDGLLADVALADWSLAASLHRLARVLLPPLHATDAAALAFAGMPPNAAPPDARVPGDWRRDPDAEAARALAEAAARIAGELAARLPQWAGPALVQRVAERRAVIVADPGWIEVRMRLADVSVDLRRAALDLDPGFLPWLGIVVRIVYA
jgi:hypothetical protein